MNQQLSKKSQNENPNHQTRKTFAMFALKRRYR